MNHAQPLRIAILSRFLRDASPEGVVGFASKSRLDGIVWSEGHVSVANADRVRDETREGGLEIVGYAAAWYVGRGAFAEVVDVAALLGAPRIHLGATALVCVGDRTAALVELRRALDVAQKAGIAVSLSSLPGALDATLGLIRDAQHASLRLSWRVSAHRGDEGPLRSLRGFRFYVPDVPAAELTTKSGRRLREEVAQKKILAGASDQVRFAVLDPLRTACASKSSQNAMASLWSPSDLSFRAS